ncbi:MAG: transposase [Pirellulaceae bacterium]
MEQPIFRLFDPDAEVEITARDLPHWFQSGVAIFVTFRTFDSMPQAVTRHWRREQIDWLERHGITVAADHVQSEIAGLATKLPSALRGPYRKFRDRGWHQRLDEGHGECLLRRPELAAMVAESIQKFDADRYDLDSFVVMPNHVHVLLQCRRGWTLRRVATTWLEYTARRINKALGRSGHFWQSEPFDHLVRSAEQFLYLRHYIRDNPAHAGLKPGEYLYWTRNGAAGSPRADGSVPNDDRRGPGGPLC